MASAVLDQPEQIAAFALSVLIHALEVEVKTGMKLARNQPSLKEIRRRHGITAKTKKAAIPQLKDKLAVLEEQLG